jgi:hypothetical protein
MTKGCRVCVRAIMAGAAWLASSEIALAQSTDGCPIAVSDYGREVARPFTDSHGRRTQIFFHLPVGHDPTKPTGILMYFHGNDLDPNDSYVAPLELVQDRADAHGLIAAGLKSIGTRTNPDGTVVREWLNTDSRLLDELLLSDFGGCFKIDRSRVYLEGASEGTCFLAAALSDWLWRDFQGGVLGLCGCWGTGDYDYPVDVPTLRSRFKVLVENTTLDFLYDQGVMGLDIYKYNFGLDVRADLDRPGTHCQESRVNAAAALDWMTKSTTYSDPDANRPHWQFLDTQHNGLEDVDYDATKGRFVLAVQRPDLGADVLEHIEQVRGSMFAGDPQGFLDWRIANYPEYAVPPVLILTTSDYGANVIKVGRRESTGGENLADLVVAPDGSILVSTTLGVRKVNESTKTLDMFAFDGKLVYGLDRDDSGNLFAHGALIHLQRSRDSGVTWTELAVPVKNQFNQWTVGYGGGYLTVIGSDGQVYSSQNAGDAFQAAPLPAGTVVDFANHGPTFFAVMADQSLQVSRNAGTSWQAATLPGGAARAVFVMPNGDALIAAAPAAYGVGLVYRSKDAGQSWVRERGAHDDARMEFASGPGDQAMMVTTRGIFRHSTGALLDLGNALPPIGGVPISDGGSAHTDAGQGGGTGAGGGGAVTGEGSPGGAGGAQVSSEGSKGCGCRLVVANTRSTFAAFGALTALAMLARRRGGSGRRRDSPQRHTLTVVDPYRSASKSK